MKKKTAQLAGQATAEQIAAWKTQYPEGIYAIALQGHIAYFREPDVDDMNEAAATSTNDAPLDYFKIIGTNTCIGGSKAMFDGTDRPLFLSFIETIKPKLNGKKGELVNL